MKDKNKTYNYFLIIKDKNKAYDYFFCYKGHEENLWLFIPLWIPHDDYVLDND